MSEAGQVLATGRCDADGLLVSAGEPLAGLQLACGGTLPGEIAIPALYELVEKSRNFGLKLARAIRAHDGHEIVTTWIEVGPAAEDDGSTIRVTSWQAGPLVPDDPAAISDHRAAIDRTLAELSAQLDSHQALRSVEASAPDLTELAAAMRAGLGRPWTDFITLDGSTHEQPMHWRLLDGAEVKVPGSDRRWRANLLPHDLPGSSPLGFELCLTAETPLAVAATEPTSPSTRLPTNSQGLVGRDIAPVLRQPIARIIANAETIRTRMAGPLAEEYSQYAADIASAGQHLLALVEDLADLEVVEADQFNTAPDRIDLADVARRAAGILGVRANERGIAIDAPKLGETLPAIAEFRRVLQVLLNLVGNAIRYAPDNSSVWIRLEDAGNRARIIVADQGPGLTKDQQVKVFEKFERLGRSGEDGGSGLGLYISRRLARAMGGDLLVESAPGQGARFILEVPADLLALAPTTAHQDDSQ